MTYQIIYSSEATVPMQAHDLEELLQQARRRNGEQGISGALVYTDGVFLQVLEGERDRLHDLMESILKDVRHEHVAILREGEVEVARFSQWKMAYVSATPEQVAQWAGIRGDGAKGTAGPDVAENLRRTAQFARDLLALASDQSGGTAGDDGHAVAPGTR